MALSAAALLDELMGKDRDRAPHEKGNSLHWSDPDVRVHFQDYDWRLTSIDTNIEHAIFRFASTTCVDFALVSYSSTRGQIWVS